MGKHRRGQRKGGEGNLTGRVPLMGNFSGYYGQRRSPAAGVVNCNSSWTSSWSNPQNWRSFANITWGDPETNVSSSSFSSSASASSPSVPANDKDLDTDTAIPAPPIGSCLAPGVWWDPRLSVLREEWFRDKHCLDIGCNTGHFTLTMALVHISQTYSL
jgi:hypothetical protein